ncbi:MAG: GIY-YIG nuclease family protein [Bacteroidales bacterium]|nr:GIY-YIG nuclease family protein [Bacteroidales bacterium]
MVEHKGYVYFMTTSSNKVLYVGVTNSLKRRIMEHSEGNGSEFTRKYNCNKLVYYESFPDIGQAIVREKQIKHFKREWKNELVESVNPDWLDLKHNITLDPDIY